MNVFKEVYKIAIFMKEARIYVHSAIMIISETIPESVWWEILLKTVIYTIKLTINNAILANSNSIPFKVWIDVSNPQFLIANYLQN